MTPYYDEGEEGEGEGDCGFAVGDHSIRIEARLDFLQGGGEEDEAVGHVEEHRIDAGRGKQVIKLHIYLFMLQLRGKMTIDEFLQVGRKR